MPRRGVDVVGSIRSGDVDFSFQFDQSQIPPLEKESPHLWLVRIIKNVRNVPEGANVAGSIPSGDVDLWLQFEQEPIPMFEKEFLHFWIALIFG